MSEKDSTLTAEKSGPIKLQKKFSRNSKVFFLSSGKVKISDRIQPYFLRNCIDIPGRISSKSFKVFCRNGVVVQRFKRFPITLSKIIALKSQKNAGF